jgi:hypothetical protein
MTQARSVLLACAVGLCLSGSGSFAGSPVDAILERTGQQVELFWQQIPSYKCRELVTREKIEKKGKVEYKQELEFDYLALTKKRGDRLTVEEVRLPLKGTVEKSDPPSLLDTNGFPTLQLIFHPRYQAHYRFHIEEADGGKFTRIRFEPIPGEDPTSGVMVQGKAYALDLQGTAWIDSNTGAIQKIAASLVHPMPEINVEDFTAEVVYELHPSSLEHEQWLLPSRATIDLQTGLQHWRNIHYYSEYKRFSVNAEGTFSK